MKIAYNGLFLTRPFSGIGQYTVQFFEAITKALPRSDLVVFVPEAVKTKLSARVQVVQVPLSRSALGRGVGLDYWERCDLAAATKQVGADLYHTPYATPPINIDCPVVMTVHDVIPWQLDQYRQKLRSKVKLRKTLKGIQQADHITTVSESAKKDIVEVAGVPANRISVTYESIKPELAKPAPKAAVERVKRKFNLLAKPYLFYIGGYDYRKNVRGLIEGFARSGLADQYDLVVAGAVTAPKSKLYADFANLPQMVAEAGLTKSVKMVGFVSEEEKHALLSGAAAFVYPSLKEAFGLPILEALAAGTPVAASNIPSTIELFGKAVCLFDPEDPETLAGKLREVATRPDPAKIRLGKQLLKQFQWSKTARATAQVYRDLVK